MRRRFLILPGLLLALTACDRDPAPVAAPAEPASPLAPVMQPSPPPPPPVQTPRPTQERPPERPSEPRPQAPAGNGHLPLARILAITQADTPGEVLDVEFDDDDDDHGPAYEITVLTAEGRSIEIKVDARTGAILDREED